MEKVLTELVDLLLTMQVLELVDQVVVLVLERMVNGMKRLVNLVVDQEQDQVVLVEVR